MELKIRRVKGVGTKFWIGAVDRLFIQGYILHRFERCIWLKVDLYNGYTEPRIELNLFGFGIDIWR